MSGGPTCATQDRPPQPPAGGPGRAGGRPGASRRAGGWAGRAACDHRGRPGRCVVRSLRDRPSPPPEALKDGQAKGSAHTWLSLHWPSRGAGGPGWALPVIRALTAFDRIYTCSPSRHPRSERWAGGNRRSRRLHRREGFPAYAAPSRPMRHRLGGMRHRREGPSDRRWHRERRDRHSDSYFLSYYHIRRDRHSDSSARRMWFG